MFEIGDYIIYGNNGVCKVVEIGPIQLSGINNKRLYYTLEPVYEQGSKVYTPVGNKKVLMREIISKDEAAKLIDEIPDIEFDKELNDKEREHRIRGALRTIDCREWIRSLKLLYFRKQERNAEGKKITSSDEKFFQAVEDCLYGELSISMDKSKEEIEEFILSQLKEIELA